jgi:hypothetical protein
MVELGAVQLRLTLLHQDPIDKPSEVVMRNFATEVCRFARSKYFKWQSNGSCRMMMKAENALVQPGQQRRGALVGNDLPTVSVWCQTA